MDHTPHSLITGFIYNNFEPTLSVGDRVFYDLSKDSVYLIVALIDHLDLYYNFISIPHTNGLLYFEITELKHNSRG